MNQGIIIQINAILLGIIYCINNASSGSPYIMNLEIVHSQHSFAGSSSIHSTFQDSSAWNRRKDAAPNNNKHMSSANHYFQEAIVDTIGDDEVSDPQASRMPAGENEVFPSISMLETANITKTMNAEAEQRNTSSLQRPIMEILMGGKDLQQQGNASDTASSTRLNKMRLSSAGQIFRQMIFPFGMGGYKLFRIPSIIRTTSGKLLAMAEGRQSLADHGQIDIVLRSSEDDGFSWSNLSIIVRGKGSTVGNPTQVVDHMTGLITLVFCSNGGNDNEEAIKFGTAPPRRVWKMHSKDDGQTWSPREEISHQVRKDSWTWYAVGPGHGIQLKSGRLVVPANHAEAKGSYKLYNHGLVDYSHIIYSDDSGLTWQLGANSMAGSNEAAVAETSDGGILINSRNAQAMGPVKSAVKRNNAIFMRQSAETRNKPMQKKNPVQGHVRQRRNDDKLIMDKASDMRAKMKTTTGPTKRNRPLTMGVKMAQMAPKQRVSAPKMMMQTTVQAMPSKTRLSAWSANGGESFQKIRPEPDLIEPKCQASLLNVRLENVAKNCTVDAILFSNPASHVRNNMAIHASTDDGENWTKLKVVNPGASAYSDMAVTRNGNLALMYEKRHGEIAVDVFNLAWLLSDGKDLNC